MSEFTKEQLDAAIQAAVAEKSAKIQELSGEVTHYKKTYEGINPEKARADAEAVEQLKRENASTDPKKIEALVNEAKEAVRKEFGSQINDRDTELAKLKSELKEERVVNVMFGKFSGQIYEKAQPDFKDFIRRYCDQDAEGNIIIKDDKGEIRRSKSNAALPMTVDEMLGELKETRDYWFNNPTGEGTKTNGYKTTSGANTVDIEALKKIADPVERQKVISKLDPSVVNELLAAASRSGIS